MTKEDWIKIKTDTSKCLFGQVPTIEIDGKVLCQSGAITRHFARVGGIIGESDDDKLRVDMLYEGARDFYSTFLPIGFKPIEEVIEAAKSKVIPTFFAAFSKALEDNGSNGYLVGNKTTLADLALFEVLLVIEEVIDITEIDKIPSLKVFFFFYSNSLNMYEQVSFIFKYK
jgi:glutathione S-transferase